MRKRSQMQLAGSKSSGDLRIIKKASSCSTIYIDDSTVSQPNLKNTIKVVSLAIYYHIKNRTSNQVLDIFDEKIHPLTVSYSFFFKYFINYRAPIVYFIEDRSPSRHKWKFFN